MLGAFGRAVQLLFSGNKEVFFIAWTSLRLSLVSVVIASSLSLPLGFLIGLKSFRGKKGVIAFLNALIALPTVVVGLLVYSFISRAGPLGSLGLLFSPGAINIGQVILCFPLITSLVYSALSRLDRRLPETLITLGAKHVEIFWMTLREGRIAILSAILSGFGRVVGEVGVAMMLGGNIRWYTRTLTTAIALETSKGEFELGLALGLILMAIAFLVNFTLHGIIKHEH
ncbi:MAG: ABC transporter permease [Spirochaetaceae bacterium]|nr:MAG: ABC transporter permease [Spirochaetaceae bacterium]